MLVKEATVTYPAISDTETINIYSFTTIEEIRGYAKQLRYELYLERERNRRLRSKARLHKQAIRQLQNKLEVVKGRHAAHHTSIQY